MTIGYDPKLTLKEVGLTISHLGVKKANTKLWQLLLVAVKVATAKTALTFWECFILGFFCNILVVLAIIMSYFPKILFQKSFALYCR